MLLGDIIARLTDETTAAETILGLGDLGLLADMRRQAEDNGVSLGAYSAWIVRTYADNASSDEWTNLMSALNRSDDPGATCLQRAFGYVLTGIAESAAVTD
ncbi:MAG: hypothetical protein RLO48_17710 [Bauldia litoralis]